MTVLCLIETAAGRITDPSARALAVAARLADSAGQDVAAAWFGGQDAVDAGPLAAAGARIGYAIESDRLTGYAPQAWARALAGLAADPPGGAGPATAVLAAATDHGAEVLAHLGASTGLPMAANCVSAARLADGAVRVVRQRWAGLVLEEAVIEAPMALLTVAAEAVPGGTVPGGAVPVPGGAGAGLTVHGYRPELAESDLTVLAATAQQRREGVSLGTARVVVGGGRGVGGPDGFAPLEELAGLLGAAVGVSRVVTSEGWRPHRQQVGQTGTKIAPDLYLACGISGAIQHMAGCQGAKTIVAINTDPGAPIIAKADYAVIGDLHEVIPALVEAIRARRG
ncbi:MAG: electron transfer flavoprotein subunit alpha/FixB family protein [Streptosporangiaceae bacterium]